MDSGQFQPDGGASEQSVIDRLGATQTAAWLAKPYHGAQLEIRNDIAITPPAAGEVLIRLECTGVCHSDLHCIYGETLMDTDISGHEGVGRVARVGAEVPQTWIGKRVGTTWQHSTCNACEICLVNPTACPNQHNYGRDRRGTFAQYVTAPAQHIVLLPEGLKSEIIAPLLCAGLTMWSAIAKATLQTGNWIAIYGAGGGLGHLGVQIAKYLGLQVVAIDTSESKRLLCKRLGAEIFLDFKVDDVVARTMQVTNGYGVHAVVLSAGSESAYDQGFKLLRALGTLVCIGLPRMSFNLPIGPFMMVVRGLRVIGSSVGTPLEMQELLQAAAAGHVGSIVEIFEFHRVNEVLTKLDRSEIQGRAVLQIT